MGMLDYVAYKAKCRKCGNMLDDWQSKDGDCLMDTIHPEAVNLFYTSCNECGAWNKCIVNKDTLSITQPDGTIDMGRVKPPGTIVLSRYCPSKCSGTYTRTQRCLWAQAGFILGALTACILQMIFNWIFS